MSSNLKQDISIGKQLKLFRKKANLTQDQVAAQLTIMGYTITSDIIAKMEQGKYSIKISILIALKDIYQIESFDEIFADLL